MALYRGSRKQYAALNYPGPLQVWGLGFRESPRYELTITLGKPGDYQGVSFIGSFIKGF